MSPELVSFMVQKRGQGVPWHHIAAMSGTSMATLEPYKALEAGYRASKQKAEAAALLAPVRPKGKPVPDGLIIPPPEMRLTALRIAAEYGEKLEAITGPLRRKGLSEARHHVMWALRQNPKFSTTAIGAFLGGRDHSTVLYGSRQHAKRIAERQA